MKPEVCPTMCPTSAPPPGWGYCLGHSNYESKRVSIHVYIADLPLVSQSRQAPHPVPSFSMHPSLL